MYGMIFQGRLINAWLFQIQTWDKYSFVFKPNYLLNLLFTDILKIDNLWEFTKLTKLQLDNNIIEKIEGLESLVNLVWLGKCVSVIWIACQLCEINNIRSNKS